MRKCKHCLIEKAEGDFYSQNYNRCKPCHSKAVLENRKNKRQQYLEYQKEYIQKNKDKVRQWTATSRKRWEQKHGLDYNEYLKARKLARKQQQ